MLCSSQVLFRFPQFFHNLFAVDRDADGLSPL
jgi:hypothetical protein